MRRRVKIVFKLNVSFVYSRCINLTKLDLEVFLIGIAKSNLIGYSQTSTLSRIPLTSEDQDLEM